MLSLALCYCGDSNAQASDVVSEWSDGVQFLIGTHRSLRANDTLQLVKQADCCQATECALPMAQLAICELATGSLQTKSALLPLLRKSAVQRDGHGNTT